MKLAMAAAAAVTAFSGAMPGAELPQGWRALQVARVPPAELTLVAEQGATVLRVRTDASAGAAAYALRQEPGEAPVLAWRWKVERSLEGADLRTRAGDDFAARVYVFFDVPEEDLPLFARLRMHLARLLHGAELPTAALCYVWDNREPPAITGIAAGADTDQTRERSTAWFGDFRLEPRR